MSKMAQIPVLEGSFEIQVLNSILPETFKYSLFETSLCFENSQKSFLIPLQNITNINQNRSKRLCLLTFQMNQMEQISLKFSSELELLQFMKKIFSLNSFKKLINNYEIQQKIGKGSQSVIYQCQKQSTRDLFALKLIILNRDSYSSVRAELDHQISILNSLNHQSIVNLKEVIHKKNQSYLIQDLCKGGNLLNRLLQKNGFFTEQEVKTILKQLLESLKYIHSKGIMHRDIKMENILLVDQDGLEIKVTDFGLSEYITPNGKQDQFKQCGSMGYIAPEIFTNRQYDEKVDIFSSGVLMYGLLTGEQLFSAENFEECAFLNKEAKINEKLVTLQETKGISTSAVELLQMMLEKNHEERISAEDALKTTFFIEMFQDNSYSQQIQ